MSADADRIRQMTSPQTVREVLERTRSQLADESRWSSEGPFRTRDIADGDGNVIVVTYASCLGITLCGQAGMIRGLFGQAAEAVTTVIREQYPDRPWFISGFNDDPRTVHADILAVLDKAIAGCEG